MKARKFLLAAALFATATTATVFAQDATNGEGLGVGTPKFDTVGSVTNFSANAQTITYFRSQFTDPTNGKTYPITMVGTNPAKGDHTTTIQTVIIPIRFTFAAAMANPYGPTLDGTSKVGLTMASPVFQSADIGLAASATASAPPADPTIVAQDRTVQEPSDKTQVGDAIYRAQWGLDPQTSKYHVLLGQPQVLPTVSYNVPANQGYLNSYAGGAIRIGFLDEGWFSNRLNETMRSYQIPPNVLPIFLVYNTFLTTKSGGCCILGYHGATSSLNGKGQQLVHTYMFAAYSDNGIFRPNPGDNGVSYIRDIHALSHEVQEWMDDPFVNNRVNPWLTPTAPQYGCTTRLETGDPVVGYGFTVTLNGTNYHPEDEVHASWFEREQPSTATMQYYTYLNNFADPAKGCQ